MTTFSALGWSSAQPLLIDHGQLSIRKSGPELSDDLDQPPVVLLHGLQETSQAWSVVAEAVSTRTAVVAPDLPGFGGSGGSGSDAEKALEQLIDHVREVSRHDSVDLVGHGWGATLAIGLTARGGSAVRRLAVISGAWPPSLADGPDRPAPGLKRWQRLAELAGPPQAAALRRSYLAAQSGIGAPQPQRSLVIWGAHDRRLRPRYGEKVVSALGRFVDPASVEMVTLPGVGSAPPVGSGPTVGALLCDFLQAP